MRDFRDAGGGRATIPAKSADFIQELTGADAVAVSGMPILRFGERSAEARRARQLTTPRGWCTSTRAIAPPTRFAERAAPNGRPPCIRRVAQHNIWRAFSEPPQDVPLAVCDARTIAAEDLVPADARFDRNGQIAFSFEALLLKYSAGASLALFLGYAARRGTGVQAQRHAVQTSPTGCLTAPSLIRCSHRRA